MSEGIPMYQPWAVMMRRKNRTSKTLLPIHRYEV